MCNICKMILSAKMTMPEARAKLPRLIDLEQNTRKREHYKQVYGNMEKAYARVFGSKDSKAVWRDK